MTLATDYNVYIGSSTGAFKGLCLQRDKVIIKNIQNIRNITNKASVVALNWGNEEETEILVAYAGQKIKTYDTDFKNFNTNTDVSFGEGEIVGVSRYDECILTAVQSGDVKLWRYKCEGNQWSHFNVGKNLECMKHNTFNNIMASGGKENDLKLWDLNTTENIFTAKNVKPDEFDLRKPVWVNAVDFLPNSDKIVVCSKQGYVRVYDPKMQSQRRPVLNVEVPNCAFTTLSTTNQNHYVVVGSTTGDMMAIDLRGKGKPCYKYKGFTGCVKNIVCPKNENVVLSVSMDRHFRCHDFHSKKLMRKEYLQSRLTSILVRSDFSLDELPERPKENSEPHHDDEYDPEYFAMDKENEVDEEKGSRSGDEQSDSGSDLEIIEEGTTLKNNPNEDSNEEDQSELEEEGEEEESENEYYEETDEEEEQGKEDEKSSEDDGGVEDHELFPPEKGKKRKLGSTDTFTKKKK